MSEIRQTEGWGHCLRCGKDVAITSYGRPTLCHLQSASCVPSVPNDRHLPRAYQFAFAKPSARPFAARIYPLDADMMRAAEARDILMTEPAPNHNYDVQISASDLRGRPLPEPAYDHWTRTDPLRGEEIVQPETRDEFRERIGTPMPRKPKLSARLLRQMAHRAAKSTIGPKR